jgi:hypothetical protein
MFYISSLFWRKINKKVVILFISRDWIRTGGVTGFTGVHRCFIADSSTLHTGQLRELQKGRDKGKASHVELTVVILLNIFALQYFQLLELHKRGRKGNLTSRTYCFFIVHICILVLSTTRITKKGGIKGQDHCTVKLNVFYIYAFDTSNYRNYGNARIKGQSHHF